MSCGTLFSIESNNAFNTLFCIAELALGLSQQQYSINLVTVDDAYLFNVGGGCV